MNTADKHLQAAAIVCHHVATMGAPILYAEKSEPEEDSDSGWQFLCGSDEEDWQQAQVWALSEVLEKDTSLAAFVGFPTGAILTRSSPSDPWHGQPLLR